MISVLIASIFVHSKSFIEEQAPAGLDITKGKWSWSCSEKKSYKVKNRIQFNYEDTKIHDLTVDGYTVIKDAKIQPDDQIGQSVFDVKVGKISKVNDRQIKLDLSLQDYSDEQSFAITLIGDNEFGEEKYLFKAVMISTLFTSDGDSQLHTTPEIFDCTAKTQK